MVIWGGGGGKGGYKVTVFRQKFNFYFQNQYLLWLNFNVRTVF